MQTETIEAWQVDEGDLISLGGDTAFTVASLDDTGDDIALTLRDDDGETETLHFTPDDPISLVVSLDDPEDEGVESET